MQPLDFLNRLARMVGPLDRDEGFIFCGFVGDPNTVGHTAWRPRLWKPGMDLPINPARTNGYLTVSTFRRNARGEWRRRQDCFAGLRLLMVDDVGTGPGSKVHPSTLLNMPQTFAVETSPNNYQYLYVLREPERNQDRATAIIKAFIAQKLLGNDPGMAGINRVFRVPGFVNGKEKYRQKDGRLYRTDTMHIISTRPEPTYTAEELIDLFRLNLRPVPMARRIPPAEKEDRCNAFDAWYVILQNLGVINSRANLAGWTSIECPWREHHSDRANTGAAIRDPAPDNEWWGAFRCHHGHCAERGWSDLTDWICSLVAEELDYANQREIER